MSVIFVNPKEKIKDCVDIWNSYVKSGSVVFNPVNAEKLASMLEGNGNYTVVSAALCDENGVVAFGTANTVIGSPSGYITYIAVREDKCRQGFGTLILQKLEELLCEENKQLERIEAIFYNPCQIPWTIPNAAPHGHPGAPGVDMDSAAYPFFKKHGYFDYAIQNAYYLPLSRYEYPEDIAVRIEALKAKGIEICYYKHDKHYGFPEFFDNIKNDGWRKQVLSQLDKDIVIAADNGKVVGYTGPLTVSKDGRGMFCGIGVHTEYRQHGIGGVLFASLCKGLSEKGAEYMSLFTGTTNPARKIYEGAGFAVVRSFADLRKVL